MAALQIIKITNNDGHRVAAGEKSKEHYIVGFRICLPIFRNVINDVLMRASMDAAPPCCAHM